MGRREDDVRPSPAGEARERLHPDHPPRAQIDDGLERDPDLFVCEKLLDLRTLRPPLPLVLDLLASARINVRFYVYEGFFLFGQYNYTWFVWGEESDPRTKCATNTATPPVFTCAETRPSGVKSVGSMGFNVGLGYAF